MICPNCGKSIGIDIEKVKDGLARLQQMFSDIRWTFNLLESLIRENLYKRRRWSYGEIIVNLPLTETASIQVKAGKRRFFLEQDILFELTVDSKWYWINYEIPDQYMCLVYNSLPFLVDAVDKAVPEAGIRTHFQRLQQIA